MPDTRLSQFDFNRAGLVLLTGVSGSGKSTRLARLVDKHPLLSAHSITWIMGSPINWKRAARETHLLAIDELSRYRDLLNVLLLLHRGHW